MNKRQKKKQFKKKYGMNPAEYEEMMAGAMSKVLEKLPQAVDEATTSLRTMMENMVKAAQEAAVVLTNSMNEWAQRAQECNKYYELIKNAHPLPDGVDMRFLEDLGEQQDPYGYPFHLYRDNANSTYFIDYGGEHE